MIGYYVVKSGLHLTNLVYPIGLDTRSNFGKNQLKSSNYLKGDANASSNSNEIWS